MVDKYILARSRDDEILASGECGGAVTSIFKYLLDNEKVDGVLSLRQGNDIYDGIPTYTQDSSQIAKTGGSLHCATTLFGDLIKNHLSDKNIALTAKPCDAMSINELVKRKQIDRDKVFIAGLNCGGSVLPDVAREMIRIFYEIDPMEVIHEEIASGKFIIESSHGGVHEVKIDDLEAEGFGRRENCQRCELSFTPHADIASGNWGAEDGWTFIEVISDRAKEVIENAEKEGYIEIKAPSEKQIALREKLNNIMHNKGVKSQKTQLEEDYPSQEDWDRYWNRCIKCYSCRDICPICYCVECVLEKEVFVPESEVPPSPLTFQGVKLAHMGFSCINCGQCEDVCPSNIPLSKIYKKVQNIYKEKNDFTAGVDEDLPQLFSPEKEAIADD